MKLSAEIEAIHRESRGTYGVPRIHAELAERGIHAGRKRVARLMRGARLQGVSRRKAFRTTVREETARPAPDLVERQFAAAGADQLWVADITYVPTWAGFLFLAVVVSAWSRRVIGWAMETHLRTELVLAALDMAVAQRRPTASTRPADRSLATKTGQIICSLHEARRRLRRGAALTPGARRNSLPPER